jgi:hypothetical protein
MTDIKGVIVNGKEFLTVKEMAESLKIKPSAVKVRLHTAGQKPVSKDALYSVDSFNIIKDALGKGRPKKKNGE